MVRVSRPFVLSHAQLLNATHVGLAPLAARSRGRDGRAVGAGALPGGSHLAANLPTTRRGEPKPPSTVSAHTAQNSRSLHATEAHEQETALCATPDYRRQAGYRPSARLEHATSPRGAPAGGCVTNGTASRACSTKLGPKHFRACPQVISSPHVSCCALRRPRSCPGCPPRAPPSSRRTTRRPTWRPGLAAMPAAHASTPCDERRAATVHT